MKYVASVSFGKDSLAMLLRLIEENRPLDAVVFCDTGMEYQAIYDTRDMVVPILKERGINYTEVKIDKDWDYWMLEYPVKNKDTGMVHRYGLGWCGHIRWGTSKKVEAVQRIFKGYVQYVGIAYDEKKRADNMKRHSDKILPLVEWKMTEKDCLDYVYSKGFYYQEDGIRMYDLMPRVSCWCCKNARIGSLRNIYKYLPKYWEKLKDMQSKIKAPMKDKYGGVFELETRFKQEIQNEEKQKIKTARNRKM